MRDGHDPGSRGPDEHPQAGQDHRPALRGVPGRPGGQAQPEDLRQVRGDHRPLPVVPGALLARSLRQGLRRDHPGQGDLLRHVRGRGHHLRVLGVPRLLHAPQGHRRQRDDEGRRDGHQEARPVAGREGLHRGRRIGPGAGGRGRTRPARQPEAPRRAVRLARRDRPGHVRQGDRRPFPDPADRPGADLAGAARSPATRRSARSRSPRRSPGRARSAGTSAAWSP